MVPEWQIYSLFYIPQIHEILKNETNNGIKNPVLIIILCAYLTVQSVYTLVYNNKSSIIASKRFWGWADFQVTVLLADSLGPRPWNI